MLSLQVLSLLLATTSPWAPTEWKIHLNFGRENETPKQYDGSTSSSSEDWGMSGARLALTVPVCIQSDTCTSIANDPTEDFLGQRGNQLQVLGESSFVSMKGLEHVKFGTHGAWRLSTRRSGSVGDASTLRMIVELQDTIHRNDVIVRPQKVYLMASAWREDELEVAQQRMLPIRRAYEQAKDVVEEQLSHETGDRRLDGNNILDTAAASFDMANLVKRRDDRLFELQQAKATLPHKELSQPGDWPGSDEALVVQEGVIMVKQKGGFLGIDGVAIVGRWTASPMEPVEYYEDDSEEEEADQAETTDGVDEQGENGDGAEEDVPNDAVLR